jgi:hypothetical protein
VQAHRASLGPSSDPSYGHFTDVTLPTPGFAVLIYPGCEHWPDESVGYIRSKEQARRSWRAKTNRLDLDQKLPLRDYVDEVRTPLETIHQRALAAFQGAGAIIIPARNVGNELGFQIRLGGQWYRRADDKPLDGNIPALRVPSNGPMSICQLGDAARSSDDVLVGLPLVVGGQAMNRARIIATASDMAWLYPVDPEAKFGPPAPAWSELQSISYQRHLAPSSFEELVNELDSRTLFHNSIARRQGRLTIDPPCGPALPHSVVANRGDEIHALVITGSLWDIATTLAANGFEHAMLIDQSGSTRYSFLHAGRVFPIVGTANWRDKGTCFLAVRADGWLWNRPHSCLTAATVK